MIISENQLISVNVPRETNYYKPVPNEMIIEEISRNAQKLGLKIEESTYTSDRKLEVFSGVHTFTGVGDSEIKMMAAWRNSYNRKRSFMFAVGSVVTICSNGMIIGKDILNHKRVHKGRIREDFRYIVGLYLENYEGFLNVCIKDKETMKSVVLSKDEREKIVGKMFLECDFINPTQLSSLRKEIKTPSFEYNAKDTLWELYQHTTHALKSSHPSDYIDNYTEAHKFFMSYVEAQ